MLNQMDLVMLPRPSRKRLQRLGFTELQWDALVRLAHVGPGGLPLALGTSDHGVDGRTARCLAARPKPPVHLIGADASVTRRDWSLASRTVPAPTPTPARAVISPHGEKLLAAEVAREQRRAKRLDKTPGPG